MLGVRVFFSIEKAVLVLVKLFPFIPEAVDVIVNVVFTGSAAFVVVRVKVPFLVWPPMTALNEAGENDAVTPDGKLDVFIVIVEALLGLLAVVIVKL
jgi:hypothetical protein